MKGVLTGDFVLERCVGVEHAQRAHELPELDHSVALHVKHLKHLRTTRTPSTRSGRRRGRGRGRESRRSRAHPRTTEDGLVLLVAADTWVCQCTWQQHLGLSRAAAGLCLCPKEDEDACRWVL